MRKKTLLWLLPALLLSPTLAAATPYQVESIPYGKVLDHDTLTVVVSFDGSGDLQRWQEILDFARDEKVKMTFFVSGVYFLTDDEKGRYSDPLDPQRSGNSAIGFGGDAAMVARRKELVLSALADGHDIESHLNGHFDASKWPGPVWAREVATFGTLTDFLPAPPRHVRFPLLAMNDQVYPVMAEFGLRTITSSADQDPSCFKRVTITHNGAPYTFLEFPIPVESEGKNRFLLMDYNIYLNDKGHHRGSKAAENETIALYLAEAQRCQREARPLFLSQHFIPWNEDAYWHAIRRSIILLKERYPLVRFVTIAELYAQLTYSAGSNAVVKNFTN